MQAEAFTALVHGVYVVTTRVGDKVNGMTAAWVSQVSLKPLLVMVSIAPARYSHNLIKESGIFAINVLTTTRRNWPNASASKAAARSINSPAWSTTAATGAPILPQAYAYLDLKLVHTSPAGDHTLFVGEVMEAKILHPQSHPLVFKKNDFF